MKKFKSFLYDDVLTDDEKHQIVEEIPQEPTDINIIKETPTRPLGWNKKLCMTSCKNGHFTFDYI